MLVGSGGVVALVLGAWSVLWAIVAVPGASFRSYYPALAAFAGAILAFSMLTAQSELVLGFAQWAWASASERDALADSVLSISWRPLGGGALALLMSWGATAAVARQSTEPIVSSDHRSHWMERLLALAMLPLALFDMMVWVALRRAFERAVSNGESPLVALPKMQFLAALGAGACVGLLFLAALIGLIRMVRS